MQRHRQVWKSLHQNKLLTIVVHLSIVAVLGLLFLGTTLGRNIQGVHAQSASTTRAAPPVGSGNPYQYPQCTWWADERYHQLHGVYVPWTTNANAWQWTARAHDFGWHVSKRPSVGSIIDLQPWVQGAYGYGHVGVVERILRNGHVIASSTNWGSDPYVVSYTEFAPGKGVTFIRR